MKDGYKNCPFCSKEIKEIAIKCRYCGRFLNEETVKQPEKRECPFCMNEIDVETNKCPFCDEKLSADKPKKDNKKSDISKSEVSEAHQIPLFLKIFLVILGLAIIIYILLKIFEPKVHNEEYISSNTTDTQNIVSGIDDTKVNNENIKQKTVSDDIDKLKHNRQNWITTSYGKVSISYPNYFKVDDGYYEYLDYDNTLEMKKYSINDYIEKMPANLEGGVRLADLTEQEYEDFLSKGKIKYKKRINDFLNSDDSNNFTGRNTYGGYQLGYEKVKIDGYDGLITHYYEYTHELNMLRTELILFVDEEVYSFVFQYKFGDVPNMIKNVNKCYNCLPTECDKNCSTLRNGETYTVHFFENKRTSLKNTVAECFEDNYDIIMQVIDSIKVN